MLFGGLIGLSASGSASAQSADDRFCSYSVVAAAPVGSISVRLPRTPIPAGSNALVGCLANKQIETAFEMIVLDPRACRNGSWIIDSHMKVKSASPYVEDFATMTMSMPLECGSY